MKDFSSLRPEVLQYLQDLGRTEEPGALLPMGSQRVGHDLGTEEQQQAFEMDRGGWQIVSLVVKSPPAKPGDVRDADLIPESGRSAREGYGNPLQYCGSKNPMDRGVWRATVREVTQSGHR